MTDILSWFGLANQVANYAQLRDFLQPFKPFLSPKRKLKSSDELDEAFFTSKKEIIETIKRGVEIFDPNRCTCLRPHWSTQDIGYFLLQLHCACEFGTPVFCDSSWNVTLAETRFLSTTEQRYVAIEGENLPVACGLEKTKYCTQDCGTLLVVRVHKPHTKIICDRTLDEITNTRLFRLKQRTHGALRLCVYREQPVLCFETLTQLHVILLHAV